MEVEFEATFENIDKDQIREKLKSVGATLVRPEFLQKRTVFKFPEGHEIKGGWIRVRDEADKITMSLKVVDGEGIESQKEIELSVSDYDDAVLFLENVGCKSKGYQETRRELWSLDGVDITIDEWPFLEPFVEVEGTNEETVKAVSEKLGFNYSQALFDAVGALYVKKYQITLDTINQETPKLVFEMENPFINRKDS